MKLLLVVLVIVMALVATEVNKRDQTLSSRVERRERHAAVKFFTMKVILFACVLVLACVIACEGISFIWCFSCATDDILCNANCIGLPNNAFLKKAICPCTFFDPQCLKDCTLWE
ncbi:unnamed protein product [Lymnaea stagnalis]|uniref:Uncharacterized protein n=1 Tax=Lymnaea stagnalis TaxID=6523 RepID=A0AAV2HV49_LYMST